MSHFWKRSKTQRRPPLHRKKTAGGEQPVVRRPSDATGNCIPDGIELTPISAEIIQQVKDLLEARRVDVKSLIH